MLARAACRPVFGPPGTLTTSELCPAWLCRAAAQCPDGEYICGFRLKVEESQGILDDTATNAIRMQCCPPPPPPVPTCDAHDACGATEYCSAGAAVRSGISGTMQDLQPAKQLATPPNTCPCESSIREYFLSGEIAVAQAASGTKKDLRDMPHVA